MRKVILVLGSLLISTSAFAYSNCGVGMVSL